MSKRLVLLSMLIALAAACAESGGGNEDEGVTPGADSDKPEDEASTEDGKFDRWDYQSDPDRFEGGLNHVLADLPLTGRASAGAWPSTYWPTYYDSIQNRWNNELSPAEKYDRAFNGWTPPEGFDQLRPYNPENCAADSWDAAYYEALGPLARHVSANMGNAKARDGRDSDGDGQTDECDDHDGVSTWWGLCHAWVPAAILEDRPMRSVTYNGVTFHVGDLEALLILAYNRSAANLIGSRCNLFETREEMARVYGCRLPDAEPRQDDPRPVCSEAQLNDYVIRRDEHGRAEQTQCRDTNAGAMHVVMTNYLGLQQRAFAYDRTYDFEVWNQPIVAFDVLSTNEVTPARAMELLGDPGDTYTYNTDAVKLIDVSASLTYITESHASTTPADSARFERKDRYTYILELDAAGEIIGGEYYGGARERHPDFLWDPKPLERSSVPNLDLAQIRMLVQMSRQPEVPVGGDVITLAGNGGGPIPDNNTQGVSSVATGTNNAAIASLRLELDITHTYVGDLKISLSHNGTTVVVRANEGGSDDNIHTTVPVAGFEGIGAAGEWTLSVVDGANLDTGTLNGWKLHITPGTGAPVDGGTEPAGGELAANGEGGPIPDDDESGFTETVALTGAGSISGVDVAYVIRHTYVGDLKVVLRHGGREHVLHANVGGGRDDIDAALNVATFNGLDAAGDWTFAAVDSAGEDVGTVESWGVVASTGEAGPLEPEVDPSAPETFPGAGGMAIPDNSPAGVTSEAGVPSGTTGSVVAVAVNITHTWQGDLSVRVSHGDQQWTLHDKTGADADNYVETVTLVPAPTGDLGGTWNLTVSDNAARDTGTLVGWSVIVRP